jgi:hypothetical protein
MRIIMTTVCVKFEGSIFHGFTCSLKVDETMSNSTVVANAVEELAKITSHHNLSFLTDETTRLCNRSRVRSRNSTVILIFIS